MPEELKQLLAGLAAAVSNGDAEVKTFSEAEAKKDPDVMGASWNPRFYDFHGRNGKTCSTCKSNRRTHPGRCS